MRPVHELARPFPQKYVHDDGRGNSYVPHHVVTQRLIHIFGVPPKIEVLRELYDEGKLTGVIMRLTVPGLDPVEEAGEADNPQSKTNGARAKDACSDAIKRCAMRLGLGLSLWAQKDYFLFDALTKESHEQAPQHQAQDHPLRDQTPPDAPSVQPPGPVEEEVNPGLLAKRMQAKIVLGDKVPDNLKDQIGRAHV